MKWHFTAKWGERAIRIQSKLLRSLSQLWAIQNYRRKLLAFPFSLVAVSVLFSWALQSNSCAFHAFFGIILFDTITLFADLSSQTWLTGGKTATSFSFGYVRVEVLTHFSVLCLGLLLNCWTVKKSLELTLLQLPEEQGIHTGRFIPGALVGGLVHFFMSFNNSPFLKVYKISSTSTALQKYFQGVCASFGLSLSSTSTFALSPFAILGAFSISTVLILAFALQTGPIWFDFIGGILIILAVFDALWPLVVYIAQVLLQTVPPHIVAQLEKSLREALTIDGVLEFRNELFWTLTYGQTAGTLHVRVRRDANEQLVLSKVYDKFQPLAPHLTVQVTKDDFGRSFGNLHILRDLDSSLTQVTVGRHNTPPETISPIPNELGHAKHFIYTNTARSHNPPGHSPAQGISSTLLFSDSSLSGVQIQSRSSVASSTSFSSVYQANDGIVDSNTLIPANDSGNHLNLPSPRGYQHHNNNYYHQHTVTNNNNGTSSNHSNQPNLLMSSANYFPD
ncbi:zinc transporter 6 [Folsomia candida]|uniref:zinc transporter 6 n=1 Tax=Folsomia candida TaxID=158441 RepID=UPI000B8FDEF3|nr:zinc transporter 6 [Folsomia candida]